MDKKTLKEITQRVNAYYKQSNKNRKDKEHLDAHIDALVEVFHVSRAEIEDIANQVLAQQEKKPHKPLHIKHVATLLVVIAIVVITMLSTRLIHLQNQIESGPPDTTATAPEAQDTTPTAPLQTQSVPATLQVQSVTPNYQHFLQQSIFVQILSSISPIRIYLLEYYQMHNKYPSNLDAIGLNREDMQTGKYIQDLKLGSKGQILVKATEQLGDDIFISLTPKTVMGGLNTEWVCASNFKQEFASCEYVLANPW